MLEVSSERLVLPRLIPVRPTAQAAAAFGAALAVTHAAGASAYGAGPDGWTGDGYIGTQPLPLRPTMPIFSPGRIAKSTFFSTG